MEPITLIATALEGVKLLTSAIEAANNGDATTAHAYLEQARVRYDQSRKKWDAAPGPSNGA